MGVLASVNCYTTRVNLSVALVVMINNTWIEHQIEGSSHDVHHISPCVPENASNTDVKVRAPASVIAYLRAQAGIQAVNKIKFKKG